VPGRPDEGRGEKTSPAERARVRGNDASATPEIVQITCSDLNALIAIFRTIAAASGDAGYLA